MSIIPISIDFSWLDGEQAHVVVAQLNPCSREILLGAASRPEVVTMLRQLLSEDRRLADIVTQERPAILILPEVAIAFSDWSEVDALVRSYPAPLMLISGFSVTSGALLRAWVEQESGTVRKAAWTEETKPNSERVYNGGWCWVHTGDKTECVAFLKLTSEQRDEVFIDGLDQGTEMVCIECNDLLVFPTICSDFLESGGARTVATKIAAKLTEYQQDNRKVLIAGLLAQTKAHADWRMAIADIARQINRDKVNICLVNWAFDILAATEDHDRWRAYSGLYVASERRAGKSSFKAVRRFSTEAVEGAVARVTGGCVVGGPVRWGFAANVRHIWTVAHGYSLEADGKLKAPFCDNPLRYELVRFIRRLTEPKELDEKLVTESVVDAFTTLVEHARGTSIPDPDSLVHLTLFGGCGARLDNLALADKLSEHPRELEHGLRGLGALLLAEEVEWQTDASIRSQFKMKSDPHSVLVWSTPSASITVKQEIDRMRTDSVKTKPLLLFVKSMGAAVPISPSSYRRSDIGAPPPNPRSVSEPSSGNRVLQVDLDEVTSCLLQPATKDARAAVTKVIDDKSKELKASWSSV